MKRVIVFTAATLVAFATAVRAQDVKIPINIERLAEKASETVNVTVDGPLLQLAANFLSANDPDQKMAKELISNLKGIYVRSFEFDKPGAFTEADLESLRSQLKAPLWSRMASVRSSKEGENVDVFFKMDKERITGVVVIAAEPTELTFVSIDGPIDINQLAKLGGRFGIPKVEGKPKQ